MGHRLVLVTALVNSTTWISASEKLPECTRPKSAVRLPIKTGDVAMAPAMFGTNPKASCSASRCGFESSGAVSREWIGKCVIAKSSLD